jgi:hypothetical protein
MAERCLRFAVGYLLIGVWMGLIMGITQQFQFAPVHAHVNLLGWVSLGVIGLIYRAYPHAAATLLARWHFWLHNTGLPVFMLGLFLMLSGHAEAKPGVIVGATATVVAITLFVINLLRSLHVHETASRMQAGAAVALTPRPSA